VLVCGALCPVEGATEAEPSCRALPLWDRLAPLEDRLEELVVDAAWPGWLARASRNATRKPAAAAATA